MSVELLVIIMMLVSLVSTSEVHLNSAMLLINGKFALSFWILVVGLGIVIPLIIQLLAVNHKIKHTVVAPIMVILGGLALRFIIVGAGQYSYWF